VGPSDDHQHPLVGVVRDAVIDWVSCARGRIAESDEWSLPVVAETWDGGSNDIQRFHVTKKDAWAAMDSARGLFFFFFFWVPVARGAESGAARAWLCNQSREGSGPTPGGAREADGRVHVGVLVQGIRGRRRYLRIRGERRSGDRGPGAVPHSCSGPRSGVAAAIP